MHNLDAEPVQQCIVCFSGLKNPIPGHIWFYRKTPLCSQGSCGSRRGNACICVFPEDPIFYIRGLCKEAVMDTKYKFADHTPVDQSSTMHYDWGKATRSYVGPRGWVISRDEADKTWRMSHDKYPELQVKMLDPDALPIGRHNWRIENNVCSLGQTSSQVLLMSACQEEEFTCDDGKCVNMTQRCDNIEVRINQYNSINHNS